MARNVKSPAIPNLSSGTVNKINHKSIDVWQPLYKRISEFGRRARRFGTPKLLGTEIKIKVTT